MLRQRDRTLVGAAGLMLCACAGIVTPRSASAVAFTSSAVGTTSPRQTPAPLGDRKVAIVRDPFVADSNAASSGNNIGAGGPLAPIPGLPVLPPNRAITGASPDRDWTHVVVRAVVIGIHPAALVDVAGQSLVVKPGDRLAGRRVDAVDLGGVTLSGKLRLELTQ